MKEVIVTNGPKAYIQDLPIPSANVDEVVIKVIVSGSNPKDWKSPEFYNTDGNVGDDIAGFVHAVGQDIVEFKVGIEWQLSMR